MKGVQGVVISAKMTKAVVVRLERLVQDPRYKKYVLQRTKVKARDELGCHAGDVVALEETRPLSRDIRWRVIRVLGRRALGTGEEVSLEAVGKKAVPAAKAAATEKAPA
jgi:small subunit ribosomal protein S17